MNSIDKILIVLIVLLIGVIFYQMHFKTNGDEHLPVINSEQTTSIETEEGKNESRNESQNSDPQSNTENENMDSTVQSLVDPYLESRLSLTENSACIGYLESKKNDRLERSFRRLEMNLTEFQMQQFRDFFQKCEELGQTNPDLEDSFKNLSAMKDLPSSHPWSSVIKGEIKARELSNEEIEDFLGENNLYILAEAPDYLNHYYQEVIHWGIESVLQNHHYDYVQMILKSAHQKYVCELGMDCGPNSTHMLYLCYEQEESCGLSYIEYIETLFTVSQKADLSLAYQYLSSKYKSN